MHNQTEPAALFYRRWGSADNPALLLLHGFMGSGADWDALGTALAGDYYVLAPDLPGHGRSVFADSADSSDSADYSMPSCANAIISLLDQLAIERCHLLGYSMGGRLALYLVSHFPERFKTVLLESASPGIAEQAQRAARQRWDEQIATQLETLPLSAFLQDWYAMPLFDSLRAHPQFAQMVAQRLQNQPQQLARSMRAMGTGRQAPLWEAWESVAVPILLLVGEWDQKYVGISAEMAARNRHARVEIVANAGHNVHFEQPASYLILVKQFLGA